MKLHNYRLIEEEKKKMLSTDTQRSLWMIATITLLILIGIEKFRPPVISPLGETPISCDYRPQKTVDYLVDMYAGKYTKTSFQKNVLKVKLHFLLYRESGYGSNKSCGDNNLSCGPMQFRASTYANYRAKMLKLGLVTDMGSLWDLEDSIETASYIISIGGQDNWGPIKRGEINL